MKIFQNHHQRSLRRYGFEGLANFPHHPLARGPLNLSLQRLSLFRLHQGWKLNQPGGRSFGEHLDQSALFRRLAAARPALRASGNTLLFRRSPRCTVLAQSANSDIRRPGAGKRPAAWSCRCRLHRSRRPLAADRSRLSLNGCQAQPAPRRGRPYSQPLPPFHWMARRAALRSPARQTDNLASVTFE